MKLSLGANDYRKYSALHGRENTVQNYPDKWSEENRPTEVSKLME
jgi:hypothetical protein